LKLKAGQNYSWYLASKGKKLQGKTRRFEFRTLSKKESSMLDKQLAKIKQLALSSSGTKIMNAQTYYQFGLYQKTAEELLPIWNKSSAPFIKKLMYLSYSKMAQGPKAKYYGGY